MAAGYLLAHTAASAFMALPISVVFLAIAGAIGALVHGLARSSRYTAQLSGDMEKLREAGVLLSVPLLDHLIIGKAAAGNGKPAFSSLVEVSS